MYLNSNFVCLFRNRKEVKKRKSTQTQTQPKLFSSPSQLGPKLFPAAQPFFSFSPARDHASLSTRSSPRPAPPRSPQRRAPVPLCAAATPGPHVGASLRRPRAPAAPDPLTARPASSASALAPLAHGPASRPAPAHPGPVQSPSQPRPRTPFSPLRLTRRPHPVRAAFLFQLARNDRAEITAMISGDSLP